MVDRVVLAERDVPTLDEPPLRASAPGQRHRWVAWLAGFTSFGIFAVSGALYAGYASFDGNLSRVDITGSATPEAGGLPLGDGTHPAMTVLIVGVDDRSNLTEDQLAELATEDVGTALTDTIILAHLPEKTEADDADRAVLVSIPRDSWVETPDGGKSKINSVYLEAGGGDEGAQALVQTVSNLSGLTIDHYVQVDLNGFLAISDAIGGIDVCLKEPVDDPYTQLELPAGPQTLEGVDALKFVRQRHGLPRGDLDRIVRQQVFLSAALRKVTSAGTLLNPVRVNTLLNAGIAAVTVDSGLSVGEMRTLAFSLREIAAGDVEFRTVPVKGVGTRGELSVVLLDDDELPDFFATLGTPPPSPTPTPSETGDAGEDDAGEDDDRLTVPPREIRVQVLNGTPIGGAGARVSDALDVGGFRIAAPATNADTSDYEETVIRYGPGQREAARTLAEAVPGATLERDPDAGSTLTLVIGSNFTTVKPVYVSTPEPTPSPTPTPTYESRFADDDSCIN